MINDALYGCTGAGNGCEKMETCDRWQSAIDNPGHPQSTLWKRACTVENNYSLYIERILKVVSNEQEGGEDNEQDREAQGVM